MAFKIPDSPDIIGGSAVLREPQGIQGTEVVDMSIDTRPLQDFVANAGDAYSKYLEDRERTEDQARYNGWVEHMTNYRVRLYDENQRGKAKDLYARIKEESDRYISDTTKNLPTSATERMRSWVDSQMPGYMSSAANYEAQQNEIYRKEVNETAISRNAQIISTSNNPIEIQIARDNIEYSVRDTLRGSPEDLIASTIAMQQDQASVAMISNKMLTDPKGAADLLNGLSLKEDVLDYMSSNSIAECRKALIDSARTQLINEHAGYLYSGKGTAAPNNVELVQALLGPQATEAQVEWFMADVASQGNKKAEAMKQEMVGVQNQMKTALTKQLVDAETPQERQQAVQNAVLSGNISEEDGRSILTSLDNNAYFKALETDLRGTIDEIARTTGDFDIEKIINSYEDYYKGTGDFVVHSNVYDFEADEEKYKRIEELSAQPNAASNPELQQLLREVVATKTGLGTEVGGTTIPEVQMQKLRQYKKELDKRFAGKEYVPELIAKVSTGEILGYDTKEFGQVGYGYHEMLLNISRVEGEYRNTKSLLGKSGINIDNITGDIDAQFKKIDPSAAATVKRSIVSQINAYRNTHNGEIPTEDTIKQFAIKARGGALGKEAAAVQKAAGKYADEIDVLDTRIKESLSDNIKYKAYETSDRSYEKAYKRAEDLLEEVGDDISREHKLWVETNKEALIPLVLSGRWDLITLQLKSISGGN